MAEKGLRGQWLGVPLLVGAGRLGALMRVRAARLGVLLRVGAAVAALAALAALAPTPAHAQRGSTFDNFFAPFPNTRSRPDFFGFPGGPGSRPRSDVARPAPQADYSRAPAPVRRTDAQAPTSNVLVLGDSMADWLAYGLEDALGETPEFGVIRKHRTTSGLIRYNSRNENQDWAQAAREIIAAEKPNFIVMMLGLNDRQSIRERVAPTPAPGRSPARANPPATAATEAPQQQAQPAQPIGPEADKPTEHEGTDQPSIAAPEPARPRIAGTHEFRSEKWNELYSKRIDDTIAVLKSRGVPVIWVGLPSIRGQRSTSDMVYLNELFRGRAEKAGIVFVDVWDGFVDDGGRFTLQGADFEGQIRRLRSSDGVYFTKAGARKLAHYVEREITRMASRGPVAVALPTTEPQPQAPGTAAKPGGPAVRPLSGPVMPLTAAANTGEDGLLGATDARPANEHVTVTRVLVKGEAVETPAGRGDDFVWPRRGVAPFGTDPVVATTTLPIPVMQAAPAKTVLAPNADAPAPTVTAAPRRAAASSPPRQQQQQQQQQQRPFFFPFFR